MLQWKPSDFIVFVFLIIIFLVSIFVEWNNNILQKAVVSLSSRVEVARHILVLQIAMNN